MEIEQLPSEITRTEMDPAAVATELPTEGGDPDAVVVAAAALGAESPNLETNVTTVTAESAADAAESVPTENDELGEPMAVTEAQDSNKDSTEEKSPDDLDGGHKTMNIPEGAAGDDTNGPATPSDQQQQENLEEGKETLPETAAQVVAEEPTAAEVVVPENAKIIEKDVGGESFASNNSDTTDKDLSAAYDDGVALVLLEEEDNQKQVVEKVVGEPFPASTAEHPVGCQETATLYSDAVPPPQPSDDNDNDDGKLPPTKPPPTDKYPTLDVNGHFGIVVEDAALLDTTAAVSNVMPEKLKDSGNSPKDKVEAAYNDDDDDDDEDDANERIKSSFVNEGLRQWELARRAWLGLDQRQQQQQKNPTKKPSAVALDVDEIIDIIFLSSAKATSGPPQRFPQNVALPQMVDILQDLWEAEGLDA